MRFLIKTTPNLEIVPFNYQQKLLGVFHKWLGEENPHHDQLSLYSVGWLWGSKSHREGFIFQDGADWSISAWDEKIQTRLTNAITLDQELFCGMRIKEIKTMKTPEFGNDYTFKTLSPILARIKRENGTTEHLTYLHDNFPERLKQILLKKANHAKLELSDFSIIIEKNFKGNRIKVVTLNKVGNKANFVKVRMQGDENAIKFAWCVGLGESTGSCFGGLR
ncbi:MAG: CRISPR-associated endoribonuclease Cas6 [Ignavibacteriales bacterium]|nr:MAG: CRISPR-associated endoribonuclease Cas6 [Ignavibacteriales bacterium]